jgi:thiaminase/transcriptional activator TenA
MSEETLTARLWASIEVIYAQILAHPFLRGLTDGTLERDAFRYYIVQDSIYLVDYSRALAVAAGRAPDPESILFFSRSAAEAIEVERSLHESFFRELGVSEKEVRETLPAPTNLAYTSYLLAAVYGGSFAEALGAVLPCFWIYREVGRALLERSSPDPLYRRWIETYGGEEYGAVVGQALELTDRLGPRLSLDETASVEKHFVQTSRYEWLFWDMGYRQEIWPPSLTAHPREGRIAGSWSSST